LYDVDVPASDVTDDQPPSEFEMQSYSLGHLPNDVLIRELTALVDHDRATTAILLAHIAEVDRRRLYADAGYSSMFLYCVGQFDFSEDMAGRRITAARIARRFPTVFEAVADGRLHISALCLLSKPLKLLRADAGVELLASAEHKSNDEIRVLLAERFPQPDLASRVRPLPVKTPNECVLSSHAPARVEVQDSSGVSQDAAAAERLEGTHPEMHSATIGLDHAASGRTRPLSPCRFALQLTMSAATREKLQRVQDLLAPGVPRNDLAQLLDRALDALIEKIERKRFGKTDKPRNAPTSQDPDHIPASVRRAVHERDGGRCTFLADSGRQCEEDGDLDYDHITPRADGGKSTVPNLRLRCHAHNQLAAEQRFGTGFMQEKREHARSNRASAAERAAILPRPRPRSAS
jgi:5-methylcytosine-specific restriction endonuclease McrA